METIVKFYLGYNVTLQRKSTDKFDAQITHVQIIEHFCLSVYSYVAYEFMLVLLIVSQIRPT